MSIFEENFILYGAGVGLWVYLLLNTDFLFEYLRFILCGIRKINNSIALKLEHGLVIPFYERQNIVGNYVIFAASIGSASTFALNRLLGGLFSCFVCLNVFFCVIGLCVVKDLKILISPIVAVATYGLMLKLKNWILKGLE